MVYSWVQLTVKSNVCRLQVSIQNSMRVKVLWWRCIAVACGKQVDNPKYCTWTTDEWTDLHCRRNLKSDSQPFLELPVLVIGNTFTRASREQKQRSSWLLSFIPKFDPLIESTKQPINDEEVPIGTVEESGSTGRSDTAKFNDVWVVKGCENLSFTGNVSVEWRVASIRTYETNCIRSDCNSYLVAWMYKASLWLPWCW